MGLCYREIRDVDAGNYARGIQKPSLNSTNLLRFLPCNKPGNELSSFYALLENYQSEYLMSDKDVWGNIIHFEIVRNNLRQKDMGLFPASWPKNGTKHPVRTGAIPKGTRLLMPGTL